LGIKQFIENEKMFEIQSLYMNLKDLEKHYKKSSILINLVDIFVNYVNENSNKISKNAE
jgi:hypothetical protein